MASPSKAKKPAAKKTATSQKSASKSKGSSGASGMHMESYMTGVMHGAQILMHKLAEQAQGGMKQAGQQAQGMGQAAGQLQQSAFGDNGLLPINRIGQGIDMAKGIK